MKTLYKWSVEDYHQIIESGVLENKSVELLEGEIITVSPESPLHTTINYLAVNYLRKFISDLAVIREAHPITLDNSEPEPDIAIVSAPYTKYIYRHPYAEDIYWLIEVANKTLTKDLEEKSVIYARNGIIEYWVIDLVNKKLWVLTNPQNNGYLNKQEFKSGRINPVAFPNIELEVEKLLNVS
ncbi:MAG: Uma2 family endonuclease [Xenococcaceae cyanobacterium]